MDLGKRGKRKTMIICCLICISTFMLFHIPSALAVLITYDYTGVHPTNGTTVSGSFGFDTNAVDQFPSTSGSGRYLTGFFNGTVSGGTYNGLHFDYHENGTDAGDIFTQTTYTPLTSPPRSSFDFHRWTDFASNAYTGYFLLRDETDPLARVDDLLPLDLNLADYGFARLWVDLPTGSRYAYDITSITKRAESVPEPATFLLLGAALAGVGLFRRKFKN